MPTLPWTPADHPEDDRDSLVLGSRLALRRYRDVVPFLRAALKIRRQVRGSHGAIGVSLIAQPAKKTFWTLSAWSDEDSLQAFVRELPHRDVMTRFHDRMLDADFVTWTVDTAALPERNSNARDLWADAKARLANAEQRA